MKNKILLFNSLIFIIFFLSGCSEQQQLHQKLIVQGIGIDKNESNYKVTIQALDFQNPMTEDEPNTKIIETQGETVTQALENICKQTSLKPVYSQNLILAIGETPAKLGVRSFIDFFIRHCETRPKVKICVCKNASDILKIKPTDKSLKSKNIHDLVPVNLNSDILHFVSNLKNEKTDSFAAWIEIENKNEVKEIHLKGIGIFKEDKLKYLIEKEEAFGFMILKGVENFGSIILNCEGIGNVTCSAENANSKIEPKLDEKGDLKYIVNLNIKASTISLDNEHYTPGVEETKKIIREKFKEKITEICQNLIKKLLKSEIDVFEFSKITRNCIPKYFKKIEKNWKSFLPNLKFEIFTNIK